MTESTIDRFVMREKYCSLTEKTRLISQANRARAPRVSEKLTKWQLESKGTSNKCNDYMQRQHQDLGSRLSMYSLHVFVLQINKRPGMKSHHEKNSGSAFSIILCYSLDVLREISLYITVKT